MALGCLAGGYGMEKLGRRSLLLDFVGLAQGTLDPVGLIYIGETSAPKYRGVLLAAVSLAVSTGILISHLLGALLLWRHSLRCK